MLLLSVTAMPSQNQNLKIFDELLFQSIYTWPLVLVSNEISKFVPLFDYNVTLRKYIIGLSI